MFKQIAKLFKKNSKKEAEKEAEKEATVDAAAKIDWLYAGSMSNYFTDSGRLSWLYEVYVGRANPHIYKLVTKYHAYPDLGHHSFYYTKEPTFNLFRYMDSYSQEFIDLMEDVGITQLQPRSTRMGICPNRRYSKLLYALGWKDVDSPMQSEATSSEATQSAVAPRDAIEL